MFPRQDLPNLKTIDLGDLDSALDPNSGLTSPSGLTGPPLRKRKPRSVDPGFTGPSGLAGSGSGWVGKGNPDYLVEKHLQVTKSVSKKGVKKPGTQSN